MLLRNRASPKVLNLESLIKQPQSKAAEVINSTDDIDSKRSILHVLVVLFLLSLMASHLILGTTDVESQARSAALESAIRATNRIYNTRDSSQAQSSGAPMNCLVVYGTRPELIKLMPVIRELQNSSSGVNICRTAVMSTGQHRELLQPLERYFELTPDGNLKLMMSNQSLASLFTRAQETMARVFEATQPTLVIVQGDTTTALATGLAGFHANVHVVHVEAGLRTGDMARPFPEEFNRKVLGITSSLHFAPTQVAQEALLAEGISPHRVHRVGNTVVDALQYAAANPPAQAHQRVILSSCMPRLDRQTRLELHDVTRTLVATRRHVVLVTAHRRENAESGAFHRFGRAIATLAQSFPNVTFVVPVHYNPEVRQTLIPYWNSRSNIWLVEPPAYPVFVQLLLRISIVLTDSGGLQEEGLSLGLPTLIMRTKTERFEGVVVGGAKLVGDREDTIVQETSRLLVNPRAYEAMTVGVMNPYGNGTSAKQIVSTLKAWKDRFMTTLPRFLLQFEVVNATAAMMMTDEQVHAARDAKVSQSQADMKSRNESRNVDVSGVIQERDSVRGLLDQLSFWFSAF